MLAARLHRQEVSFNGRYREVVLLQLGEYHRVILAVYDMKLCSICYIPVHCCLLPRLRLHSTAALNFLWPYLDIKFSEFNTPRCRHPDVKFP